MKTIDADVAFNAGSELWLIPDLAHSSWAHRLDWYLGFQLRRASAHQMPVIGQPLLEILLSNEIEANQHSVNADAPLMVASASHVPNRQTVVVPYNGQIKKWVQDCHQVWEGLRSPTVRVFMPKSSSPVEFEQAWKKINSAPNEVELVIDNGPL